MSATALWTSVKAAYNDVMLRQLTNVNTQTGAVDDTVGESAAQEVIDLWPVYAQVDYDAANTTHVRVGEQGVIAVLWRRTGAAAAAATVKWGEVFGNDGAISRIRNTDPRSRSAPSSNSNVVSAVSGEQSERGWADRSALASGLLPSTRGVHGGGG